MQTLHTGGAKKNHPAADPLPGDAEQPKFNQLEMVLYLQTQFGEDRCSQFRVFAVTDPPTNKTQPQTNRQDRLQYTAPQLAHSVIIVYGIQNFPMGPHILFLAGSLWT